jgi:hypothetical protein
VSFRVRLGASGGARHSNNGRGVWEAYRRSNVVACVLVRGPDGAFRQCIFQTVGCASVQRGWIASGRLWSHPRRVRSSWRASGKASACAAQTFSRGPSVPAQTVTARAGCPAARRTLTRWVLRLWVLPPLTGGRGRCTASGQRQTDLGGSQLKLGEQIDIEKC